MRASVYRMAAGGRPAIEPKLPCLSISSAAHVPLLGHADERRVDDAFAVRMVVAAGVAGDLRALHAAGAGREVQVVHRHQNAPLRGLEPVAHVGQRAADDHAHRVREIALLELVLDRQIDQPQGDRLFLGIFGRGGIGRIGRQGQILSAAIAGGNGREHYELLCPPARHTGG